MSGSEDSADDTGTARQKRPAIEIPKSTSDTQRIKINKLMSNIDKPVHIPSAPKERVLPPPPEFNRHVMGSTAGAGSGDFHTYRHLRRRTQAREQMSNRKAYQEEAQEEFQKKLRVNFLESEAKTAKNRAKRQKQKARSQKRKEMKGNSNQGTESDIQPEMISPVIESPDNQIKSPVIESPDNQIKSPVIESPDSEIKSPVIESPDNEIKSPAIESPEIQSNLDTNNEEKTVI